MITVGYTARQAERLKYRLDVAMARIEDDVLRLKSVVTDTDRWLGEEELENLREQVEELKQTIDRRTRPSARGESPE